MQVVAGTVGLSRGQFALAVSDRAYRPLTTCRTPSLTRWVELTQASRLLQRTHSRTAARCLPARELVNAKRRLPWGSKSLITTKTSGVHSRARGSHIPHYVPSSAFLTPSTIYSATGLVGLFRPTTVYRVFPSGCFPPDGAVPNYFGRCPHAVEHHRPAVTCTRRPCLDFKALLSAGIR
jgi:hypothetical protein